ncbi:MAG: hypothetical protein ACLPVY_13360 [Acidimicrobiia bacterium]
MDNLSISIAASFDRFDWAALLVSVQAGCSVDDARTLLWNTADATDMTLEELADDVVHGRVTFYEP